MLELGCGLLSSSVFSCDLERGPPLSSPLLIFGDISAAFFADHHHRRRLTFCPFFVKEDGCLAAAADAAAAAVVSTDVSKGKSRENYSVPFAFFRGPIVSTLSFPFFFCAPLLIISFSFFASFLCCLGLHTKEENHVDVVEEAVDKSNGSRRRQSVASEKK